MPPCGRRRRAAEKINTIISSRYRAKNRFKLNCAFALPPFAASCRTHNLVFAFSPFSAALRLRAMIGFYLSHKAGRPIALLTPHPKFLNF